MAFAGYYLKVNGTTFPNGLLAREGYSNIPNIRTDKNSYVDGKGVLNRSILPVKRSTIKIKTIDGLTYGQKLIIKAFFIPRDLVTLEYWNDEEDAYKTTQLYVPEIEYTHKTQNKGQPVYNSLEINFIAYKGDQ